MAAIPARKTDSATALAQEVLGVYKRLADGAGGAGTPEERFASAVSQQQQHRPKPRRKKRAAGAGRPPSALGQMEARDDGGVWRPVELLAEMRGGRFRLRVLDGSARELVVGGDAIRAARKPARGAVLLPKGAAAWAGDEREIVVAHVASEAAAAEADACPPPETSTGLGAYNTVPSKVRKYYTLEKCYEELGRSRTERAMMERENAALKGRIRSLEKQGAYQLDDLLTRAAPMLRVSFRVLGRDALPAKDARQLEELYNVLLQAQGTAADGEGGAGGAWHEYVLRGTKADCFQAVANLKNRGFPVEVSGERADNEVALHTAARLTSSQASNPLVDKGDIGYVCAVHDDASPPTYDVRFAGGVLTGLSPDRKEIVPLQSPVLWCNVAKVNMPLAAHGHFNIVKAELQNERERSRDLERRVEALKAAQDRSSNGEEVKRIAQHIEASKSEAELLQMQQRTIAELTRKLDDAVAEKEQLSRRFGDLQGQSDGAVRALQDNLREERAARIVAERLQQLEGTWRCGDSVEGGVGGSTTVPPSAAKVFEIVASADKHLRFSEVSNEGVVVTGVLVPCGSGTERVPPALVGIGEYRVQLSDGGVVWLGRTDKGRLVRAYRSSAGERSEVVTVATKVEGATPAAATPRRGTGDDAAAAAAAAAAPATADESAVPASEHEARAALREATAALETKDAELQEVLRAFDAAKKKGAGAGEQADELRELRRDLDRMRDAVDERDAVIADLRRSGAGAGAGVSDAATAAEEAPDAGVDAELHRLRAAVEERDAQLRDLRSRPAAVPPPAATADDSGEVAELRARVEAGVAEAAGLRARAAEAEGELAAAREERGGMEAALAERNRRVVQLQAAVVQAAQDEGGGGGSSEAAREAEAREAKLRKELKGMQEQVDAAYKAAQTAEMKRMDLKDKADEQSERLRKHKPMALLWKVCVFKGGCHMQFTLKKIPNNFTTGIRNGAAGKLTTKASQSLVRLQPATHPRVCAHTHTQVPLSALLDRFVVAISGLLCKVTL